jgi:hypothetical protein
VRHFIAIVWVALLAVLASSCARDSDSPLDGVTIRVLNADMQCTVSGTPARCDDVWRQLRKEGHQFDESIHVVLSSGNAQAIAASNQVVAQLRSDGFTNVDMPTETRD